MLTNRRGPNGAPIFERGDIDDSPHAHVEKSVQQERRSIVVDVAGPFRRLGHAIEFALSGPSVKPS